MKNDFQNMTVRLILGIFLMAPSVFAQVFVQPNTNIVGIGGMPDVTANQVLDVKGSMMLTDYITLRPTGNANAMFWNIQNTSVGKLQISTGAYPSPDDTLIQICNAGTITNGPAIMGVNGYIIAHAYFTQAKVWSDYVFKPDYNLMPLKNVEKFIQTQGHLPGIPSEKEVHKTGVNIGEMQVKLLEKVEELTLHIIEQDKRISEQENKINALLNAKAGRRTRGD